MSTKANGLEFGPFVVHLKPSEANLKRLGGYQYAIDTLLVHTRQGDIIMDRGKSNMWDWIIVDYKGLQLPIPIKLYAVRSPKTETILKDSSGQEVTFTALQAASVLFYHWAVTLINLAHQKDSIMNFRSLLLPGIQMVIKNKSAFDSIGDISEFLFDNKDLEFMNKAYAVLN